MPIRDDDPLAPEQFGVSAAADRRRAGRQDVSPDLIPLLRGKFDLDAPPDPHVPLPFQRSIDQQFLTGAVAVALLLLAGVALRYVV